ncbi:MAG TPA: hypothetical protein VKP30_18310, partial [Polyangiaceae bacterium]|nr:hypothetical protein [Polyangiaceae bacterium]
APPTSSNIVLGRCWRPARDGKEVEDTKKSCRDDGQTSSARRAAAARPPLLPFARSSLAASTNLGGASTRGASAVVGSKTLAAFTAPAALLAERGQRLSVSSSALNSALLESALPSGESNRSALWTASRCDFETLASIRAQPQESHWHR